MPVCRVGMVMVVGVVGGFIRLIVESVDQGAKGLRFRSGWRLCILKTHINRVGACV